MVFSFFFFIKSQEKLRRGDFEIGFLVVFYIYMQTKEIYKNKRTKNIFIGKYQSNKRNLKEF